MSLLRVSPTGIIAAANESTTGWTPASLPGLVAWYDASDASTVHATAGSVDTWDDKSGNTYHATASTTARPTTGTRTINSLNVLDFDGTSDVMSNASIPTLTQSFTVACVAQSDVSADSAFHVFVADITNGRFVGMFNTNVWAMYSGNLLSGGATDTNAHYFICVHKTPSTAIIRVGASETTGNCGSGSWVGGIYLGGQPSASWFNGRIAEVVITSNEIDSTNRNTLGTYFTTKWGV